MLVVHFCLWKYGVLYDKRKSVYLEKVVLFGHGNGTGEGDVNRV